jgi:RNA polymerase sigma factor FliA
MLQAANNGLSCGTIAPDVPPLGPAEADWWAAWTKMSDPRARDALLALHLPYARVIAAMIYAQRPTNDIEFDDYLQFARVGLLEAFERYDPNAGAMFRTFAAPRMRGAVLDGVSRLTERHQQMALRRRLLASRTASLSEVEEPSSEEGIDLFRHLARIGVGLALGFALEDSGMFAAVDEPATSADPSYQATELRQTRLQISALVGQLPSNERRVIDLHYQQGHAFEDIARQLDLTKGRISQIHKKALGTLRELLSTRKACDRAF